VKENRSLAVVLCTLSSKAGRAMKGEEKARLRGVNSVDCHQLWHTCRLAVDAREKTAQWR